MDSVLSNIGIFLVQNSETGVNDAKIIKNHIFLHFSSFYGHILYTAPVNDGTQHLITSIRHKPHIGRNNGEKIDVDGGKKRIKWNCRILWSAVSPEWLDDFFRFFTRSYTTMRGTDWLCHFITEGVISG